MDNEATVQAVCSLELRMAVPPKRAVLVVADAKVVGQVLAGRDGTLRDADRAVHSVVAAQLQAMPMQRDAFIALQTICDVDNDTIPRARFNERPGKLVCAKKSDAGTLQSRHLHTVDKIDSFSCFVWRQIAARDVPMKFQCGRLPRVVILWMQVNSQLRRF